MKSIIDISTFIKQPFLSNRITKRKTSINNNNNYHTTSNQTLNYNSNEKNINKNNRNLKSNLNKNSFINKTQTQSKEKSKSKSKSRDEIYLTNKILKNNLKYPEVNNEKNNFMLGNSNKNIQKSINKITIRIYENSIDKLFLYMKSILPNETYNNIKNKFLNEITKEINGYSNKKYLTYDDTISSSITNIIKNKILKDDLSNNNNITKSQLSYNLNEGNNNISCNNNTISNKHSSLYTLTKSKILNSKTMSNSKSKSKSGSKSNSKQRNEFNKSARNNKKISMKKYTFGVFKSNNLNSKLFQKINSELLKIDLNPISYKKNTIDGNNKINIFNKKSNEAKFIYLNNRNNKISTSHTTGNSLNKKEKHIKSNFSLNFNNKNNMSEIIENKTIQKHLNLINKNNKNNIIKEVINESKNSEQLKEIKSSLDENLKIMFNFSYEDFLNKESETESKKSMDENNNNSNNNNISKGIYQSKYKI